MRTAHSNHSGDGLATRTGSLDHVEVISAASTSLEPFSFVSCECNPVHPITGPHRQLCDELSILEIVCHPWLSCAMSCNLLPCRKLFARFRPMIYDFDPVYVIALGQDIELLHEWYLLLGLEHFQLVPAIERAVLTIVRPLHLAL
jgi:hypothetical protein